MRQVPESEIEKRLGFDNPWWEEGKVDRRFRDWPRRAYLDGFIDLVTETTVRRAVVLMGPRRVGKTVMIYQTIQHLIDEGVAPTSILYLSADTPVYTGIAFEKLLDTFRGLIGHARADRLYVFYDEVQYHPDWEAHLKSLVDSYPHIRFVASGSAAAALKMKSRESGAGRFTDFILPPLTFAEFLRFRGIERELIDPSGAVNDIKALNVAFIDYLNFGGFPEAVMEERVRAQMDRYVASDIIDKVLLRDLPSLYGVADPQELNRLFTTLAYNTGHEVNIDGLSQASQVSKNTLKKYLEYLEAAFLIRRLHRVDQNARRFKKQTHFKVYLTNPSLRAALFGAIKPDDENMGRLAETAIVSQFAHSASFQDLSYARWNAGEVDLVWSIPNSQQVGMTLEIKWSDRAPQHPDEELKALLKFCLKTGAVKDCWISTKSVRDQQFVQGVELKFFPAAEICLVISRELVDEKLAKGGHPLTGLQFRSVDRVESRKAVRRV